MSRWLTQLRLAFRSVFLKKRLDQELDEELQYHLQREIDEALNSGLGQQEAQYAARREMGAIAKSKEECRDMRGVNFIDDLLRDLRYAKRSLRRSPGFAALAVLIMALGIGANTAVFSVVNAVLLKPLAYRDPDRIVMLTNPLTTGETTSPLAVKFVSIPNFKDWHDQSSSFEAMAFYYGWDGPVMTGSTAEYANIAKVSPEFFRVFAVEPVAGRSFSAAEVKPGNESAVMIGYGYWQSHFGGDLGVLGRTIRVYNTALTIVGVLPPGFRFPDKTDLWFPDTDAGEQMRSRGTQVHLAVGRLKPGVSIERAQTEMTTIARRLEQQYPETNKGQTVALTRMRDDLVGDVRLTLYLLFGAVSVVLLIACANTATLLLGKATARKREVALRTALGASRMLIVRQLITESLVLAFFAGAAGLLFAYEGSNVLVALAPADLPQLAETGIDRWVLAFTFGVSILTSVLFGLVPALYASKVDLNDALKQAGTRSVTCGGMARMRGVLVVAEIALAVVLLLGAGLLIKSFVALQNVALGFRPENVLVMRATGPGSMRDADLFFKDVVSQIAAVPGVAAAGVTMVPPGHVGSTGPYYFDHRPERPEANSSSAVMSIVGPGTFAALGIPLKSGRDFNENDTRDQPFVAVVNEELARKSPHGENPIGRTIFCDFDSDKAMMIIGIAGDVRERGPAREPIPECYMPYRQHAYNSTTLSVVTRTTGNPVTFEGTLRRLAHERSPDVPVTFTTMENDASQNVAAPRFRTLLLGVFAGLALCLAMAGVYGVMAYAVSQRSNEIGLRMALGASTGSVLRLILARGLACASLGLAMGLAAATFGTRLLASMLFQVQPNDPLVYVGVAVLLSLVTLVASYVPARRASRIDPLAALRQE